MTVTLVAHHALLLAIPAFVPAFVVVGVVVYIAAKDRRQGDADDEQADNATSGRSDQDGTP